MNEHVGVSIMDLEIPDFRNARQIALVDDEPALPRGMPTICADTGVDLGGRDFQHGSSLDRDPHPAHRELIVRSDPAGDGVSIVDVQRKLHSGKGLQQRAKARPRQAPPTE
ncbi:hypothetical protein GCM10007884_29410 [Methylobacterium brachythecii]|uniref:Response regulatory domain-containing protein n=1 Tax=Methylobacterium brachythecii TaxID=1176177 RepID=A0ABQ6D3M3_9HYPH|nr:hypothetical protein GCM10007884_29410 [Methylobacterium brachythecii]